MLARRFRNVIAVLSQALAHLVDIGIGGLDETDVEGPRIADLDLGGQGHVGQREDHSVVIGEKADLGVGFARDGQPKYLARNAWDSMGSVTERFRWLSLISTLGCSVEGEKVGPFFNSSSPSGSPLRNSTGASDQWFAKRTAKRCILFFKRWLQ